MPKNKVKYGLKNVYYAPGTIDPATNTATYDTPVSWPGAVSLTMDAEGGTTKFRADNIDYWVGQANNGYSGDFESALVPDSFRVDILGDIEDANGVLVENAEAPTKIFALLFQFEGDIRGTRHVLYNCTATRPSVSGQTTEEEIEPQTETMTLTSATIFIPALGINAVKGKVEADKTAIYNNWFNQVYQTTGSASEYQITFDSNGGSAVASETVTSGGTVTQPTDPTLADHTFAGWFLDPTFTQAYDFTAPVYTNLVLYAKWEEV